MFSEIQFTLYDSKSAHWDLEMISLGSPPQLKFRKSYHKKTTEETHSDEYKSVDTERKQEDASVNL